MLDLKVMRLSPPQFSEDAIDTMVKQEVMADLIGDSSVTPDLSCSTPHLLLPTSLTKVLSGEKFVAYLHLANNSTEDISDVTVLAELKINGSSPDVELYRSGSPAILHAGKFLDTIVSHVLNDRGVHTVDCCVRYKVRGEAKILR